MAAPVNIFSVSVERVFSGWTALQIAVENGFGGSDSQEKAKWMVEAVTQWFQENDGIQPDELENFLNEIMSNEFDTVIDDGSIIEVSRSICGFHRLCEQGKGSEVMERVQKLPKASVQQSVQQHDNSSSDEDDRDTEMNVEHRGPPQPNHAAPAQNAPSTSQQNSTEEAMEEDDGWEVVKRGKRK